MNRYAASLLRPSARTASLSSRVERHHISRAACLLPSLSASTTAQMPTSPMSRSASSFNCNTTYSNPFSSLSMQTARDETRTRLGSIHTPKPMQGGNRYESSVAATAPYGQSIEGFPSIILGANRSVAAQGEFAEAQAEFLNPDPDAVATIRDAMLRTDMGIVAHYYMDVELQGILQAVKHSHPDLNDRVGIADSLKMGDMAVNMCKTGTTSVTCLGVDFMSESVAAIMSKNGYGHVPVYRATSQAIGCSLAESAERDSYKAWLQTESDKDQPCLHVVYINTSLETKAISSSAVPTITCTSSNVLQTILQASVQVPDIRILYGPDTYMGLNLQTLLDTVIQNPGWDDAKIASDLHASHNNESLQRLRDNLVVFPEGNCIVHHMFGAEVAQTVRDNYNDCFMTAHLEVPGDVFEIAMEKSLDDKGVVGSTADILNFITRKVKTASESAPTTTSPQKLKFILGTEAGMVTSIVKNVQDILDSETATNSAIEVEIIFPVAAEAVTSVDEQEAIDGLTIVPGVSGGEGCSTSGGCATCPFMKMNSLETVENILNMVERTQQREDGSPRDERVLFEHLPPNRLKGKTINGVDAIDLGTESIVYMRSLMQNKCLPEELTNKVQRQ